MRSNRVWLVRSASVVFGVTLAAVFPVAAEGHVYSDAPYSVVPAYLGLPLSMPGAGGTSSSTHLRRHFESRIVELLLL